MLCGLHIENIAAIDSLDMEFEGGLNVLTGETGAGKSIIIDSINMVTGARTSKSVIRSGCDFAFVQALFFDGGEEILLSRKLFADGRSVCKINGSLATAAEIRERAADLLAVHGQHENKILTKQSCHRELLDKFAGTSALLDDYRAAFSAAEDLSEKIDKINSERDELLKNLDMLRFRYDELLAADLKEGEDEQLSERRDILANTEKIASALARCHALLYGSGGAHDQLSSAVSALSEVSGFDKKLASVLEILSGAVCEIDDAALDLGRIAGRIESNPTELDFIEQRLDLLTSLKHKYGGSIGDIIQIRDGLSEQIADAEFGAGGTEKLEAQLDKARAEMTEIGNKLSRERAAAAKKLSEAVEAELEFLDMKNVRFEVSLEPCKPCRHGFENVGFLISTIPGDPPKPLIKIASGGELSRIMLAIQTVITDDTETLIFDEIDSGVSGRAASRIAKRLRDISHGRQVICITHLAQIAAAGDCHFLIEKAVDDSSARSTVTAVSGTPRALEIARIIGGETVSDAAVSAAEELLKNARQ